MRPSRAETGRTTGYLAEAVVDYAAPASGWPTPQTADGQRASETLTRGEGNPTLLGAARAAAWASPAARDYRTPNLKSFAERGGGLKGEQLPNQVEHLGPTPESSPAATARRVVSRLNPGFSLWLMGFPATWSLCSPGWSDWDTTERLLALYYAGRGATAPDA